MGRLSFSLLVSQITSEDVKLYCIIIIKTSSQISCFWLCSLPYCPWDPRNTSWRFLLLKIIYIWLISIAEEWLNMHSKILVLSSWSHGGIITMHSDSWLFSTLPKAPILFPSLGHSPRKRDMSTHPMANGISHSTTQCLLSYATSQYDMLQFFLMMSLLIQIWQCHLLLPLSQSSLSLLLVYCSVWIKACVSSWNTAFL